MVCRSLELVLVLPQEQLMRPLSFVVCYPLCFRQVSADRHPSPTPAHAFCFPLHLHLQCTQLEQLTAAALVCCCALQTCIHPYVKAYQHRPLSFEHQSCYDVCHNVCLYLFSCWCRFNSSPWPLFPNCAAVRHACHLVRAAQGKMGSSFLPPPDRLLWWLSALWVKRWVSLAPSPSLQCCLSW